MKVRNTAAWARLVPLPAGDTVHLDSGESFDTTDEHARSLAEQDGWELDTKPSKKGAEETDQ